MYRSSSWPRSCSSVGCRELKASRWPDASSDGARLFAIHAWSASALARDHSAGRPVVHEHVPEQVDVGLRRRAVGRRAEQIAGERLERDRRAVMRQRRPQAGTIGRTARGRLRDDVGDARDAIMNVDVRDAPLHMADDVRGLRHEGHVAAISADGGMVAGAVRRVAIGAPIDARRRVLVRVTKQDRGRILFRDEHDETAVATDRWRVRDAGERSTVVRDVHSRAAA